MKKFLLFILVSSSITSAFAITDQMRSAVRCSMASKHNDSLSTLAERKDPNPLIGLSDARITLKGWKSAQLPTTFLIQTKGEVCVEVLFEGQLKPLCVAYHRPELIEGLVNLELYKFLALQLSNKKEVPFENFEVRYMNFRNDHIRSRNTFVTCEFVTRQDSQLNL